MGWWSRWLGARRQTGRPAAASTTRSPPPVPPPEAPAAPAVLLSGADRPPVPAAFGDEILLAWLLGQPPPVGPDDTPMSGDEQAACRVLDRLLALPVLPEDLLPRTAALMPQLLALLRQAELPVGALAGRIARDHTLSAELLKLASSAHYRAGEPVTDLEQAIVRVGEAGVQTVIARVVLRPIFDAPGAGWSARAAERLQRHAEVQAAACKEAARAAGLPALDGYLAGLLHSAGWLAALRAIDKAGATPAQAPGAAFAEAFSASAHRLFGRAASRWAITPGFDAFAADARAGALAASSLPLARAFVAARPRALAALLAPPAAARDAA